MMQHRRLKGKKIEYRPMVEAELLEAERVAVYDAYNRASDGRGRIASVVAMARRDRPQFEALARWVVATCKSGMELPIAEALEAQGIECWCPTERKRKPPRRGQKPVEIMLPVFRGYLFVRVLPENEAYAGLLAAAKLQGLMSSGGAVYLMPKTLMERLMLSLQKRKRKHKVVAELPTLVNVIGKTAVVRSGPFSNFLVTVREVLEKRGEVVVDIPLFGGMTEMTMDIDSILP